MHMVSGFVMCSRPLACCRSGIDVRCVDKVLWRPITARTFVFTISPDCEGDAYSDLG